MSFSILFAPIIILALILLLLAPVFLRLLRRVHLSADFAEWVDSFSPATYRPMEGLLAEEDFTFLHRQPGFESSIAKKLRQDRLKIFKLYLYRMIGDFNRLHAFARYQISQSQEDRSDLLMRLVWLRVRFSVTVLRIEMSVLLAHAGFQPLWVNQVIAQLDEMTSCLRTLQSSAAAA